MSAEPRGGTNDGSGADGKSDAPGFQRDEQRRTPAQRRTVNKTWRRRRDRWGKFKRIAVCDACGRRLWVNWTRSRPCLWCDDYADESKAPADDIEQSAEQSAANVAGGAVDVERVTNDGGSWPEVSPDV